MVRTYLTILGKDLRLELRRAETIVMLLAIAVLVLIALVFALDPPGSAQQSRLAAGALWVSLLLAGTLGAGRVVAAERENGCDLALLLSPADPAAIFCAKLTASFIFIAVAGVAVLLLLILFFNLGLDWRLVRLGAALAAGGVGFAAMVTLLAALAGRMRLGELLLPVLAIPLYAPALIAGVKISEAALNGAPLGAVTQWMRILLAFDLLFLGAGYLLYEYVQRED